MVDLFLSFALSGVAILLNKKFPVFKKSTVLFAVIIIISAQVLGKTLKFYTLIPNWDKILHFFSGILFYQAGKEIYFKTGNDKNNKFLYFSFPLLFAISVACLWEIWEFTGDMLFKTNAQNNSLKDTMQDIILGSFSPFIIIVFNKIIKASLLK